VLVPLNQESSTSRKQLALLLVSARERALSPSPPETSAKDDQQIRRPTTRALLHCPVRASASRLSSSVSPRGPRRAFGRDDGVARWHQIPRVFASVREHGRPPGTAYNSVVRVDLRRSALLRPLGVQVDGGVVVGEPEHDRVPIRRRCGGLQPADDSREMSRLYKDATAPSRGSCLMAHWAPTGRSAMRPCVCRFPSGLCLHQSSSHRLAI